MASRIITLLSFLIISFSIPAQQLVCGTQPPTLQQQKTIEEALALQRMRGLSTMATTSQEFAIVAHIVRNSDGSGGISESDLNTALANVNDFYANANMSFFFLDIRYIDDSKYYDYFTGDEGEMTAQYQVNGVINVYFVNSATNGEFGLCGYAYFPGGPDVIVMANGCTMNGSTFPHEIGHYFSLYHTHGTTNTGTTDELVVRPGEESTACVAPECTPEPANCDTAGDRLCDTAADPNVSGQIDGTCAYVPNGSRPTEDANGDAFVPDGTNIMSYSTKECRNIFSDGQYGRMAATAVSSRDYLHRNPVLSQFSIDDGEVCLGETVSFTDKSINAVSYAWTFEGGTPAASTDPNPVILYETPGSHGVTLLTTDANGNTDEKYFDQMVTVREEITSSITTTSGSFEEANIREYIIDNDGVPLELSSAASAGAQSIFIRLYLGQNGSEDYLVLDPINTETARNFNLTFDYAYVALNDANTDLLEVVYRDPCSDWISVWSKQGLEMQTAPNDDQFVFFPSGPEEWSSESALFEIPAGIPVAEVALRITTDNGNTIHLDNYELLPFTAFSISDIQVTNPSCTDAADGGITVVTSSEESLEYRLGDGAFGSTNEFSNLTPGTYQIAVRNSNGFQLTDEVILAAENEYPSQPLIQFANSQLQIDITSAESIEWYLNDELIDGTGATAIDSAGLGVYSVVLSNGTCSVASAPFEIFDVSIVDLSNASCSDAADGSFTVVSTSSTTEVAFGIGGYGSQTVFSGLIAGEYTISVRGEGGYEIIKNVRVESENEYPEMPEISFSNGALSIASSESEEITWFLDGELVNSGTTQIDLQGSGAYTVTLSNGSCSISSDPFVVLSATLVEESLSLYPNPATNFVSLKVSDQVNPRELSMSLTDLTGRVLYKGAFAENLDVSDLKGGLYVLQVRVGGQMISRRFMKK